MKAAVIYRNGPPEVLSYEDSADPTCDDNGVLIRVKAVSIEGGDTSNRFLGELASVPHIVGYQASGEVIAMGKNVSTHKLCDKVTTVSAFGSHAELRTVPAMLAFPIPVGLGLEQAAAVPIAFGTADDCLFEFGHLEEGETVLIQAGAGAVGLAAIQLAKRAGARVLATASSDERLSFLTEFGMDHGINYVKNDLVAEVMRLTDGKGVDLIVDPVGGDTLQKSIYALGYRGRVCSMGQAGRQKRAARHLLAEQR